MRVLPPPTTSAYGNLERALNASAPAYTHIEIAKLENRNIIRFAVDHAGERRHVELPVFRGVEREAIVNAARETLDLARYLDDLRQGMRDLVDP